MPQKNSSREQHMLYECTCTKSYGHVYRMFLMFHHSSLIILVQEVNVAVLLRTMTMAGSWDHCLTALSWLTAIVTASIRCSSRSHNASVAMESVGGRVASVASRLGQRPDVASTGAQHDSVEVLEVVFSTMRHTCTTAVLNEDTFLKPLVS